MLFFSGPLGGSAFGGFFSWERLVRPSRGYFDG
jgi:hypothetical protein